MKIDAFSPEIVYKNLTLLKLKRYSDSRFTQIKLVISSVFESRTGRTVIFVLSLTRKVKKKKFNKISFFPKVFSSSTKIDLAKPFKSVTAVYFRYNVTLWYFKQLRVVFEINTSG